MKRIHKKLLALCISVSMCVTAMSGCGTESTASDVETQSATETQTLEEQTGV